MAKKIKLVMSGSGTKFPVFIGALRRLEEAGYEVEAVAGTSGGALVAAGMASGHLTSKKMESLVRELLPQIPKLIKPSLPSLIWNFGFYKTDKLHALLEEHLVYRMGSAKIPCKIVTVDVDAQGDEPSAIIWSSETNADRPLALITTASMAIPYVFQQVLIDGHDHVDGGLLKNFAIDSFGDADNVVGLTFSGKLAPEREAPWYRPLTRLLHRGLRLFDLVMARNVREDIEDAKSAVVIPVTTRIDGLDFEIDQHKISEMIQDGYNAVDEFLSWNSEALP
jgi:predicted acylesterase/phospholipase RssA